MARSVREFTAGPLRILVLQEDDPAALARRIDTAQHKGWAPYLDGVSPADGSVAAWMVKAADPPTPPATQRLGADALGT